MARNEYQRPLNRRLIGPQSNGGLFEKIRIYCPLSEFELNIFRGVVWSLYCLRCPMPTICSNHFRTVMYQECYWSHIWAFYSQTWSLIILDSISLTELRVRYHVCREKRLFRQLAISPLLQIHNGDTHRKKKSPRFGMAITARSVAAVLHRHNVLT